MKKFIDIEANEVITEKQLHMAFLYLVRVLEDGELLEYEYSNLKHATEHFEMEMGSEVQLLEYCWNSANNSRSYTLLQSK